MGAVTAAIKRTYTLDEGAKAVVADVTFSSTYANPAGDTWTAALFGLTNVEFIDSGMAAGASSVGYGVAADMANRTLRLYGGAASGAGHAQPTNGGDQSGTVVRVLVIGEFT